MSLNKITWPDLTWTSQNGKTLYSKKSSFFGFFFILAVLAGKWRHKIDSKI